ncbi:MAG: hypothetical protein O7D95_06485 [Betaproteobacteria bacterium]|nr:hypothetical protein [Betaproteobacteria bacterium]
MATYTKFDQTVEDVNNGVHNMGSDTLKFALTNTTPVAGNEIFANITEISAGNGYTAGGTVVAITSSTQTSGTYSLVPTADVVFTASGGSIGPFRFVVLYNDTPTSPADPLISFYDRGSSLTLLDTETFTVDVQATLYTST